MLIGCLGWGSLIWDPRGLPVQGKWFEDGPFLPIEFARQSQDGRLTLVILPKNHSEGHRVRSLWTLLSVNTPEEAKDNLAEREGIIAKNRDKYIGIWPRDNHGDTSKPFTNEIGAWAQIKGLDAVVWTALEPNFKEEIDNIPSIDEAVTYLRTLPYEKRQHAEQYIRRTPKQIDTLYRRRFEVEFGWTFIEYMLYLK